MSEVERIVTPDPAMAETYLAARDRWERAYPQQKALTDAGVTSAMWRAPGV